MIGRAGLVRTHSAHDHGKTTFVELFFVFVFAVTQLSHSRRITTSVDFADSA